MTISSTLFMFGLLLISYAYVVLGGNLENDEEQIHHLKNLPFEKIFFARVCGQSGVFFMQGGVALFGVL